MKIITPQEPFNNYFLKHKPEILLFGIIGLGIFLRLYNLGKECLWFDEAITYYRAILNISEIIKNSYSWDVHPPTYYLIIHFIVQISSSESFLRLFSALCSIASLPLIYYLTFTVIGKREAFISTLFLALSVFHIRYSQEARVYSLFFLVSLLSFLFYFKALILHRKQNWIFWAVISIINFFVHYFSLILLASQIITYFLFSILTKKSLLSWKKQKWPLYAFILILIGHIPQFFFFFQQAADKYTASTSYPHMIHPLHFLLIFGKNLINPVNIPANFIDRYLKYLIGIFIFIGVAAGWKKYKYYYIINICIIFFSLLLSWISSLFIYFGGGYRFLIFLIIPYLMLLSTAAVSLVNILTNIGKRIYKYNKIKKINCFHLSIIIALLVVINLYTLFYYYSNQKKPNWHKGVSLLIPNITDNTTIIAIPEWGDYTVRYYLMKLGSYKPSVRRIKIENTNDMDSLSYEFENLIFTTDGLLPSSQFKDKINQWLKENAILLWQDAKFPASTIWMVNKD